MKIRQNYAEEMDAPQPGKEHSATNDDHAAGLSEPVSKLLEAAEAIKSQAETIGLTIDGIGRYLLNEDGTIRDFTDRKLMQLIGMDVDKGIRMMTQTAENIRKEVGDFPRGLTAHFSKEDTGKLDTLLKYFKKERFVSWLYIGIAVLSMMTCTVKSCSYDERKDELEQWYDANQEAANFARFMRLQEPDRWKYWHDQWHHNPAMMRELYESNLVDGWKSKFRKE